MQIELEHLQRVALQRGRKGQREKGRGRGRGQQRRWSTATILIDNCCRYAKSVDPLGWVSMRWYRSTPSAIAPFTALACPFVYPNNTLSVSAQGSTSIYAWSRQNFNCSLRICCCGRMGVGLLNRVGACTCTWGSNVMPVFIQILEKGNVSPN